MSQEHHEDAASHGDEVSSTKAPATLPTVLKLSAQSAAPIRALFTAEHSPHLIKHQVLRHVRQIHGKLQESERHAAQIIEEARQEAIALKEDAREEARQEVLAELHDVLAHARGEYDRLIADAEQDIVTLAMQVAQRILHHRFEVEPLTLKHMIEGSLELVRDKRQITVRVHPDDLPRVQAWHQDLLRQVETSALFFEAEPELSSGDCLIDTEAGRIDARVSVQLDNFQRALAPK